MKKLNGGQIWFLVLFTLVGFTVMTIGIFGGEGESVELKTSVLPNGMTWEAVVKKSPKEILRVNFTQDTITFNGEKYVMCDYQNKSLVDKLDMIDQPHDVDSGYVIISGIVKGVNTEDYEIGENYPKHSIDRLKLMPLRWSHGFKFEIMLSSPKKLLVSVHKGTYYGLFREEAERDIFEIDYFDERIVYKKFSYVFWVMDNQIYHTNGIFNVGNSKGKKKLLLHSLDVTVINGEIHDFVHTDWRGFNLDN